MKFIKATGCAFSLKDLFTNFNTKRLKITCNECKKINHNEHRDILAKQIFKESVKIILNDIIENNITFELPTKGRKCDIHMQRFDGEKFKHLRKTGKWRDVDFLKSYFTGYQLGLYMHSPIRPDRVKNIYVCRELRDKITANTNLGKTYC